MIRSETQVSQLLNDPNIAKIEIATASITKKTVNMLELNGKLVSLDVPWYNDDEDAFDKYYYWLSSELQYEIKTSDKQSNPLFIGTTIHYPWWRYVPLKAEVKLDKLVTEELIRFF
ncbi:hypothetical protein ACHAPJ_009741 [Fusarium lateritium]